MQRRDFALDALRGLAILGMALSGLVPMGILPAWMYHCQLPPPDHKLNLERFGITWVDLVFPFFLFAMGAAIPMALSRKIPAADEEKWLEKWAKLIGGILLRGAALAVFAIVVQLTRGAAKTDPSWWVPSLIYFFGIVLAFLRLPKPEWKLAEIILRVIGGSIIAHALLTLGVQPNKFDIILMVLAQVYVTASLIWLAVRGRPLGLVFAIAVAALLFLAAPFPGVAKQLFDFNWGFGTLMYQKYLVVVLPGLILSEALRPREKPRDLVATGLGGFCALLGVVGATVGLFWRVDLSLLLFLGGLLGLNAMWAVRDDELATRVHRWGWGLLVLGLLAEPLGGGIRKDWSTFSYLVLTPGLAFLSYAVLDWFHALGHRPASVAVAEPTWQSLSSRILGLSRRREDRPGFLALVGANPIFAYIAITHLAFLIPRMTSLHAWQNDQYWSPWERAFYAFCLTMGVGLVTAAMSRLRLFCRA